MEKGAFSMPELRLWVNCRTSCRYMPPHASNPLPNMHPIPAETSTTAQDPDRCLARFMTTSNPYPTEQTGRFRRMPPRT